MTPEAQSVTKGNLRRVVCLRRRAKSDEDERQTRAQGDSLLITEVEAQFTDRQRLGWVRLGPIQHLCSEHDTKSGFAARHAFVGFGDPFQRERFGHRVDAGKGAKFQCLL